MDKPDHPGGGPQAARVVLPCEDLDEAVSFFTERLGFRLDAVFPADDPAVVELSGHGLHLRLQKGVRVLPKTPLEVPPLEASLVFTRLSDGPGWHTGRAGMLYRDLIPGRQGGRFIASHIRIPGGGPVADVVHYHRIRFQLIYCTRGWVRVVYEDQGEPFVLEAGDCVLQPPEIRHRVLEASPGLEVIEIGCPAEHETRMDHDLALPTREVRPDRDFGGQRFVRHVAAGSAWSDWRLPGFEVRDTGIAEATRGLASVGVVRPRREGATTAREAHRGEFLFLFVLNGAFRLPVEDAAPERLTAGDSVVVPAGIRHALEACSSDLEFLEVRLPATFETSGGGNG